MRQPFSIQTIFALALFGFGPTAAFAQTSPTVLSQTPPVLKTYSKIFACPPLRSVKSTSGAMASLDLINQTGKPIQFFWINPDGGYSSAQNLASEVSTSAPTGSKLIAKNAAGQCLGEIITVAAGRTRVTFAPLVTAAPPAPGETTYSKTYTCPAVGQTKPVYGTKDAVLDWSNQSGGAIHIYNFASDGSFGSPSDVPNGGAMTTSGVEGWKYFVKNDAGQCVSDTITSTAGRRKLVFKPVN